MISIRHANLNDLNFIDELEKNSFDDSRRSTRSSIRNSIISPNQETFIAEIEGVRVGAVIIKIYKITIRIYSIAVMPKYRGNSIGRCMIEYVINLCKSKGCKVISLEADANNIKLVNWYESLGFTIKKRMEDYYEVGEAAYKMIQEIE